MKRQGHQGKLPLISIPVGGAFECIGMDFIELECSKDGNRYALVLQDYLTKWPEVYAMAETVAKCLLDVVWKHGVPLRVIYDRAAECCTESCNSTGSISTAHILGGSPANRRVC